MLNFGLRLLAGLALFGASSSAFPQDKRQTGLLPSDDPFYEVPSDIASYKLGAIIKHRAPPSPLAAFGVKADIVDQAYQLLYRTNDDRKQPTATVLTVMVPQNPDLGKLLSFQSAEDAASIDCAPSFGFQQQALNFPGVFSNTTSTQMLLIEGALKNGWVVVTADSQGTFGAFLPNLSGFATLDGIRAALNSGSITGISKNPIITMWGYSGAAGVTQIAQAILSSYAPELKVAGAAVGGVASSSLGSSNGFAKKGLTLPGVNKARTAGFIPTALIGTANQYPQLQKVLDQHLLPQYKDKFYRPRHQCLEANIATFQNQDVEAYFDNWPRVFLEIEDILLGDKLPGAEVSRIPTFIYEAVNDSLDNITALEQMVNQYCSQGALIELQEDVGPELSHTNDGIVAAPNALAWLKKVMDDGYKPIKCTKETVNTTDLSPDFLDVLPKSLQAAVLDFVAHAGTQADSKTNTDGGAKKLKLAW